MSYSERLHIPWWWIVLGLLFVGSVALAVIAYLELWLALTVIVLSALAVGLGLLAYNRTNIAVSDGLLRVGRYRLERSFIGQAIAYDGEAGRRALGPEADNREFLFTRPFIDGVVRVVLNDPADPHSAWLVSSRHPEEFAAALNEAAR